MGLHLSAKLGPVLFSAGCRRGESVRASAAGRGAEGWNVSSYPRPHIFLSKLRISTNCPYGGGFRIVRLSAVRWDKGGGQAQATGLGRLAEVLLDARCGAGPGPVPHTLPVNRCSRKPFLLALAGGIAPEVPAAPGWHQGGSQASRHAAGPLLSYMPRLCTMESHGSSPQGDRRAPREARRVIRDRVFIL